MSTYWWSNSPADVPHPGTMPSPSNNWGLGSVPTHPTGSGYDPNSPYNYSGTRTGKPVVGTTKTKTKTKAKTTSVDSTTSADPTAQAGQAPPFPGYLTPEEQLAQAQAQAKAMIQPYLDVLNAQQARQTQTHQLQQAGLAKLYDVLGGSMVGVGGQIADIYSQGAANLGQGFQTGYSHGWQIAQQGLQGQGQGFQQSADALPAIAGQTGGVKFLQAVQQGNEEDAKLQDLISSTAAQLPEKTQAYLADIQQQQASQQTAAQRAQTAADSYQATQERLALSKGNQAAAQAWKIADTFSKKSSHFYVALQNPDGSWGVKDMGLATQKPTSLKIIHTDQGWFAVDPVTGKPVRKIADANAPKPVYKTAADGTQVIETVDAKGNPVQIPIGGYNPARPKPAPKAPPHWKAADGTEVYLDPASGKVVPFAGYNPAKPVKPGKAPFTAKARENAWKVIYASRSAWTDLSGNPLGMPRIKKLIADFNKKMIGLDATRNDATGKTVAFKDYPVTIDQLTSMDPQYLKNIGLTAGAPLSAQDVYLKIIRQYHIPARQAWKWVRLVYPNFGPDYFTTPTTSADQQMPPP